MDEEEFILDPVDMAFVHEYLVDRNGTRAAIRAGYTGPTPAWFAWKRLKNPTIRALVDQMTADKLAEHGVRADVVMAKLAAMMNSSIANYIDAEGNIDVTQASAEDLEMLDSYSVAETKGAEGGSSRSVKIKLHNKIQAIEKIAKYLNLISDSVKVDHTNTDGSLSPVQRMTEEELLAEAAKRGLPIDI